MDATAIDVLPAKLRKALETETEFAFDLECEPPPGGKPKDAKDARKAVPFLVTIACGRYVGAFDLRESTEGQQVLQYLFAQPHLTAIAHNILYDFIVLDEQGIASVFDIKATIRDPMVGQFILNEEDPSGLKDMVRKHLKKRMRTYEDTTRNNPYFQRIVNIDAELRFWDKMIRRFDRERPWPHFHSSSMMKRSDLTKWIRNELDRRWPGTLVLTKTGTQRRQLTKEEREARKQFKEHYTDRIESAFGISAEMDFTLWVNENYIDPLKLERARCESLLRDQMILYAKDDSRQTLRLWRKVCSMIKSLDKKIPQLENTPTLWQWFQLECDVRAKTLDMCAKGAVIDQDQLLALKTIIDPLLQEFNNDIIRLTKGWKNSKDETLNPDSPTQLRQCLFKDLGLPVPTFHVDRRTGRHKPKLSPEGNKWMDQHPDIQDRMDLLNPSTIPDIVFDKFLATDNETIERLTDPLGMAILNYKVLTKLSGTYVEGNLERTKGGRRLKCLFKSIGTDTGRFSSAEPNLQNIPSRWKPEIYDDRIRGLGPRLRDAFVAAPGKSLIVADQSQIELRIITHFCNEHTMRDIYTEGVERDGMYFYTGDIHTKTAKMLGIPRKLAKNVNFGFNYGMGPLKFARQIRLFDENGEYDMRKASDWKDGFFQTYPGIVTYINRLKHAWDDEGQRNFRMLSGRYRHFQDDGSYVSGGKILNAKVQGSSADLLKINMWIIEKYVKPIYPSLELLIQVHDELVYEVDDKDKEECAVLIKYVMEYPWLPLSVPVLASAKYCPSWAAKDDDNRPEVGVFYAETKDGHSGIWTPDNWSDYCALDKDGQIAVKSATAILTPDQVGFSRSIIPSRLELAA